MLSCGRSVIRADKCLLFEPNSVCSQKFLDILCPRLQAAEGHERQQNSMYPQDEEKPPPFELEILEAALMVATGIRTPSWTGGLCPYTVTKVVMSNTEADSILFACAKVCLLQQGASTRSS